MEFFRITNYEKYQAKKSDRNSLPWIMLHKKLINDWAYGELSVGERLMYVHMLLVADSVHNKFPMDIKWLHRKLQVKAPLKIEKFEKLGLIKIIGQENASIGEDIHLEDINLYGEYSNLPPLGVDLVQSGMWVRCMFEIEGQILPNNFKTLFKPMAFGGVTDGKASLICANKIHADCLAKNYADLIETTMTEIFEQPVKPEFVIKTPP